MTRQRLITLLLTATLASLVLTAAPDKKNNILSLKNTITDDNIVFPSSLDTDVNKLMTNWYLQNYTVLDAEVENKSPGEVGEDIYIKRLASMPSVIEMPYNDVVRKHIERYVYRSRTLVEQMLGMSLYYMPIFEQALEKENLPLELKYLPIVESAMDPNAVSPVGAAGLWQFMIGTAKGLGLEVNSLVDERRDPYRSSEMAAKYLKNLYQIYNDWSLAIAAYNCGPGNVNKALHRAGDKGDFWNVYEYLPRETRGYVPAFIAANYAMTYYKQHNISPALAAKPLITDTVSVNRRIHFRQIAEILNIPVEEIRTLNPQYRQDVIPGDVHPYMLILPSQQVYSFIMSEDSINNYRNDLYAHRQVVQPGGESLTAEQYLAGESKTAATLTHKVKRGETASAIAAQYGMSVDELMSLNNLSSSTVRRGTNLKVRDNRRNDNNNDSGIIETQSDETTAQAAQPDSGEDMALLEQKSQEAELAQIEEVKHIEQEAATKAPYKGGYTAKSDKGTTATKQTAKKDEQAARQNAAKANTSNSHSRNSQYANKGNKDNKENKNARKESTSKRSHDNKDEKTASTTKKGGKSKAKAEPKPTDVTVQKGESLTKIAEKNGCTVEELKQANGIDNADKIKAGDKIKLPEKQKGKSEKASGQKSGSKSSAKTDKADKSKKGSGKSKGNGTSKKNESSKSGKSGTGKKKSKKK